MQTWSSGNTFVRRAARVGPFKCITQPAGWLAGRSLLFSLSAPGSARRVVHVPMGHSDHIQTISSEFLSPDGLSPGTRVHLVLLNYILPPQTVLLWQRATTRICADGGANRLFDQLPTMLPGVDPCTARQAYLPDLIKGDLDSVRPEVRDFYTSHGVPFVDLSSDQETTDLEKCLLFLEGRLRALSEATTSAQRHSMPVVHTSMPGDGLHVAKANRELDALRALGPANSSTSPDITMSMDGAVVATSLVPAVAKGYSDASSTSSASQQQQWQHRPTLPAPQQIHGEIVVLQEQQQLQLQPVGLDAATTGSLATCSPQTLRHDNSSSYGAAGRSKGSSSHQPAEAPASMVPTADGPSNSKRVQQEHLIIVLGALGGRLDHTLANLNTLYCYPHLSIILWGDGNLVRLLRAGRSVIQPSRLEGPTCGLVPLAHPATASSKGLKWDLDNTHMCFRGLLSTSNIITSDTIEVTSDEDLLWITAISDCMTPRGRKS